MIYLDHNATTRLDPSARAAMAPFLDEEFGNPSSIHGAGRRARDAVERARDDVARLCGATRDELVFTSGGTEANQLAVRGAAEAARARDGRRGRVLVSAVEHPSAAGAAALLAARGFAVETVPVDATGGVDPDALAAALGDDVAVVVVQLANHEIGRVQPVAAIAARARACGALVVCDAVQAAGKLAVDVRALGAACVTLSAHKLFGPKGVGALFVRDGLMLAPIAAGGHQERERRPGTENVAGIVGFGAACRRAAAEQHDWTARVGALRARLEAGLVRFGGRIAAAGAERTCNTTNVAFDGAEGELVVAALDLEGVAASTGAACTSGSVEPSPVLLALGQPRERAREAIRFSLGPDTTAAEIDRVLALLPAIIDRVRNA
jgi:cysteine desulfurase